MGDVLTPLNVQHEGRLSVVESKIDRIIPMVEDLHADMSARRARGDFLSNLTRYSMWIVAGFIGVFGAAKSAAVFSWIDAWPK